MEIQKIQICQECGKKLVKIGIERANGRDAFKDSKWKTRKYHKKCFKDVVDRKFENYLKTVE